MNDDASAVLVYWNNICVLNKQELKLLDGSRERLAAKGVRLDVRQFGFGYPEHMNEHLRREGSVLPDVFVSADLEVYEDHRVYRRFAEDLYPVRSWCALKDDPRLAVLDRGPHLLPYVVIPLVLYTGSPDSYAGKSLVRIVEEGLPLYFGGVNNSAGKTVTKLVWDLCGKEAARAFLRRSTVGSIPVAAFQTARRDPAAAALVPTVYALTADEEQRFALCPTDGAVAVPSYIAVRRSLPEDVARAVVEEFMSSGFCEMFVKRGRLITTREDSPRDAWVAEHCRTLLLPRPQFFEQVNPEEFYALYASCVPGVNLPGIEPL
jgi:hypothetical protein